MAKVEIEVCPRMKEGKFHASIKGQKGKWGTGNSHDEAIGDLVKSHPEDFNLSTVTVLKEIR